MANGRGDALKRILVVDDDSDNRRMVSACLRASDVVIEEAADGLSALRRVAERPPDLVILDMDLPVLDGYRTARCIRESAGRAARVPIIALTAEIDGDAAARCLRAGADDYVAKPLVSPRILRAKVHARLHVSASELPHASDAQPARAAAPAQRHRRLAGIRL